MRFIQDLTDDELNTISREYSNGATLPQLELQYSVYRKSLSDVLRRRGVKMRTRSEGMRKYNCNNHFFDSIDTEEKAYWLGFIAADGCVRPDGKTLTINLAEKDRNHLEKFIKSTDSTYEVGHIKDNRGYQGLATITITSEQIISALGRLGIVHKKTARLVTPDITPNMKQHFWRGMVDGDGNISFHEPQPYSLSQLPQCSISLAGTERIVTDFRNYVSETIQIKGGCVRDIGGCFTVSYHGRKAYVIIKTLYENSNISLDRKNDIYFEMKEMMKNTSRDCCEVLKCMECSHTWISASPNTIVRCPGCSCFNWNGFRISTEEGE